MILIIGAGIAGLSAALHLKDDDYIIAEKEAEAGGLCRTKHLDGFFFDYTGHLLHSRDPYFASFVDELLPDVLLKHERRSVVFSHGVYTPYPFQVNTFGLPEDVIHECVLEFIQAKMREERIGENAGRDQDLTFREWVLKRFGNGFAKHFFLPFNEKLYCRDLALLSSEWTAWSIPVPSIEEVIQGAVGIRKTKIGYNPFFLYPASGGIDILPRRMASKCRNILLNSTIDSIDLARKEASIRGGGIVKWDFLISTIPLRTLLSICENIPDDMKDTAGHLAHVKIVDINIGFEGKLRNDFHWIYFPEREFPFYRVGFPGNFSDNVTPDGCSSLYAEVSLRADDEGDIDDIVATSLEALIRLKILPDERKIAVKDVNLIDPAYVVFDLFRKKNRERIISFLEKAGVITAGRFGSWDYLSMEGAFLDGRQAALKAGSMRG